MSKLLTCDVLALRWDRTRLTARRSSSMCLNVVLPPPWGSSIVKATELEARHVERYPVRSVLREGPLQQRGVRPRG
jgi:hypothetical protein